MVLSGYCTEGKSDFDDAGSATKIVSSDDATVFPIAISEVMILFFPDFLEARLFQKTQTVQKISTGLCSTLSIRINLH